MDYFNIRWPETISQKTSREVALLAFGEQEVLGGEKDGSNDISPIGMERGGHRAFRE